MTEAALASADAPHAPQVILQLLAKLGIACREVSDSAELPAARRVQAVLLDDAVGTLLVLFPQSQLLDLARLTELTGRKLLAIEPERLERMLGKHELHRLPALPPLTSSPCLYDERLLQEPRLLILDEPTNHLDPRYQLELLRLLRGLGLSTLASFHDLNLAAAFCDRLYVLDGGRIVAQGTPTEVLDADLLWRVFGVRALVDRHPLADHPRLTWITQA